MSGMAAEANEASRSLCGSLLPGLSIEAEEKKGNGNKIKIQKRKRKTESDQRCPEVEVMTEERKSRQRSGAMI